MVSRRTAVVGVGTLFVGGGAVLSTGAFTTIEAERSVSLETAGDANAFLSLEILDSEIVDETDGTIEFDIIANGRTRFENLVDVRNRGTQPVTSLRFEFIVDGADQNDNDVESAMKIVSGNATIDAVDQLNLLAESDAGDAANDQLTPGEAIPFGIEVDLTDSSIDRISGDPNITLRIIADTGDVDDDPGGGPQPGPGTAAFEYEPDPERNPAGTPAKSLQFGIKNVGTSSVDLDRFNVVVESPGQNPGEFDRFEITSPDGSLITGDGGDTDQDIQHTPYTIAPGETAEYTIEQFDRDPSANASVKLTLTSTAVTGDVQFDLDETDVG
jgi:hypothetical protein